LPERAGKNLNRKIIFLRAGEECVGRYESLRIADGNIGVVLSLTNGETVEISLTPNLVREETLQEKFRSLKTGDKMSILRISDARNPILVRKLLPDKTEG